ncbi:MAG: serine/threonine-protein kinase [Kofleriaceae bacterium]
MSLVGALLGSYRITHELSSGGMGTIYRARHELLGRDAAVKVLRAELTEDNELVDRFFTEARAASAISHPSIIEVFDFGYTPDGEAYLVMEFLEGLTLHARLKEAKPAGLPEAEAVHIARALANALVAAHAKNIVHRDLKPANIFLLPDPEQPFGVRPKVLDFGIAKLVDPAGVPLGRKHTVTGTLIGTPRYMAPEQARAASQIDHRADQYSLGCILYEMLVGHAPFPKGGSGEVIAMHLFGEVTPPRALAQGISPEIEAVVMRLLQKEPADRYANAQELAIALGARHSAQVPPMPGPLGTPSPWSVAPAPTRPEPEATHVKPFDLEHDRTLRDRNYTIPIVAAVLVLAIGAAIAFGVAAGSHGDEPKAAPPAPQPVAPAPKPPEPAPQPAPAAAPVEVPEQKRPAVTPTTAPRPAPRIPSPRPTCDPSDHTASCSPIETAP